jgi:type IV secretory pathway component VirB8
MSSRTKHSISRITVGLIAVAIVFGLAVLMVLKRYDPTVITTVVTGTSLAAAELVRRLQAPTSAPSEPDHTHETRS